MTLTIINTINQSQQKNQNNQFYQSDLELDLMTLVLKLNLDVIKIYYHTLADLGGHARCTPPYGTKFFRFHIHFCQKAPTSEVHAPPNGSTPPYRKSWIRHCHTKNKVSKSRHSKIVARTDRYTDKHMYEGGNYN